MILASKALEDIEKGDLQQLIADKTAERKTVEYKRDLPTGNFNDRKEFLADVSSFANTIGGHLLYGVEAKDGIPLDLCGVEVESIDALKLRWESMLRGGLSPHIPRLDIQEVKLASDKWVIILRIQRSWLLPHRVTLEEHGHFYGRHSSGRFRMDVAELRTAFELSGTIGERIRNFRVERLGMIMADETPVYLGENNPKIILHLIPFNAFDPTSRHDLITLTHQDQRHLIEPLTRLFGKWEIRNLYRYRYNFDGLLSFIEGRGNQSSYVQFFRNGVIEAVDVSILTLLDQKKMPSKLYEFCLCEALSRYIQSLKFLKVDVPIFVLVSFLGVKGFSMAHDMNDPNGKQDHPIDRPDLIVPEIILDQFDREPREVMKAIFDTVWNAAGWSRSMNYDASGKSTLPKKNVALPNSFPFKLSTSNVNSN